MFKQIPPSRQKLVENNPNSNLCGPVTHANNLSTTKSNITNHTAMKNMFILYEQLDMTRIMNNSTAQGPYEHSMDN